MLSSGNCQPSSSYFLLLLPCHSFYISVDGPPNLPPILSLLHHCHFFIDIFYKQVSLFNFCGNSTDCRNHFSQRKQKTQKAILWYQFHFHNYPSPNFNPTNTQLQLICILVSQKRSSGVLVDKIVQ